MSEAGFIRQPQHQCPHCGSILDSASMMQRRARKKCRCPKCGKVIDERYIGNKAV